MEIFVPNVNKLARHLFGDKIDGMSAVECHKTKEELDNTKACVRGKETSPSHFAPHLVGAQGGGVHSGTAQTSDTAALMPAIPSKKLFAAFRVCTVLTKSCTLIRDMFGEGSCREVFA